MCEFGSDSSCRVIAYKHKYIYMGTYWFVLWTCSVFSEAARSDESRPLQVVDEQGVQELVLGQRWYDVVALMAQLADHARNVQILHR